MICIERVASDWCLSYRINFWRRHDLRVSFVADVSVDATTVAYFQASTLATCHAAHPRTTFSLTQLMSIGALHRVQAGGRKHTETWDLVSQTKSIFISESQIRSRVPRSVAKVIEDHV